MIELLTNIGIVAGAILGLGIIWTSGIRPVWRFFRRMEDMHKIMVELPAWQRTVDHSLKQLYPNSGSSIHDKVMNTNRSVEEVRTMLEEHLNDRAIHRTGANPIVNVTMNPDANS